MYMSVKEEKKSKSLFGPALPDRLASFLFLIAPSEAASLLKVKSKRETHYLLIQQ